ncbi:MAG: HAD family hydrolase [Oscillospiraceae bacterium]|nr:HAD family hydrolase [Oscillospiraceae bacterium]
MRYRAVLYDMDGTVLDTLDDLADSMNHSLAEFGLPAVSREHVRQSLGNGAAYLLAHSVPQSLSSDKEQEILRFYRSWYDSHCNIRTCPYPGILPLMEALKERGIRQALISNKPDAAVQKLVRAYFPGLLEVAVGESIRVRRKPNPDAVLAAASQLGLDPSDCVYIGDTEVDLQTAENAGMDCIAVTWGFRDEEQLLRAGARVFAHSVGELKKLL